MIQAQEIAHVPETTEKKIDLIFGKKFIHLLWNAFRYLVMCGGGGSGKSEFAARKIFLRCMWEGGHKALIIRKVRATLRESAIAVMISILEESEVPYIYNKSDRVLRFQAPTGMWNKIIFEGMEFHGIKMITKLLVDVK